jgi:HEPN domain-containing protein
MSEKHEEWLKQADYDMDTADAMFSSGRYFYAVFMRHLSIEKSFKGLYSKELAEVPLKTHNLIYLLKKIEKKPDQELLKFITKLNTASIATRYPDDLSKIQAAYTEEITKEMIEKK